MSNAKENAEPSKGRLTTWKRSVDYFLSLLGLVVGFGNVWRFPYLCYEHGGGAFLIAYWTFLILLIFPLAVLESALGQYTGKSSVKSWTIIPLFKGLGYAVIIVMFYCNTYYPLLLTWVLRWLIASFQPDMPWTKCDNEWNTENCLSLARSIGDPTVNNSESLNFTSSLNQTSYTSSVEEFWNNYILGISKGIEDIGGIKWDLFCCYTAIWIAGYFSIWKGIAWTSKIVYVTATLPLAMIIVVLIRGVTLEGAGDGISMYLKPDIGNLANIELWTAAASQILYSLGTCTGGILILSSYNKFHHNFLRDVILLLVSNAAVSFLSGFAIFSVLGFLAHEQNTTVAEVADSGPGLVFVAYPTALSMLPLPHLWFALFFIMLILLGFDSFFVFEETCICCIREVIPRLVKSDFSNKILVAVVCLASYIIGISLTTHGGIYVFNIFNTYSITGWCLYFLALMELIAIGWIYGADKFCGHIKQMLGYNIPRFLFKLCWKYIGPCVCVFLMVYSFISYQPLKYGRSYVYPIWADILGWMTAFSSVLCVPIAMIRVIWKADGHSLNKKFRASLVTPSNFHRRSYK